MEIFPAAEWDFYICEIEGAPHSTLVDMSLINRAPIHGLSIFHCLEVGLRFPDPAHGMTTDDEVPELDRLEKLIEKNNAVDFKYVARQTGNQSRKFYFYASESFNFKSLLDAVEQAFPVYEASTFNFEDARWDTYCDNLYPNEIGLNEILNRRVCSELLKNGDDLDVAREVDHFVMMDNKRNAKAFLAEVKAQGFDVTMQSEGFLKKTYTLHIRKMDAPAALDHVTLELSRLALRLGGEYDGWGCSVA